ncbi:2Fe-2S iron-sulfur cluster-binding protein [Fulvivirga ligni]|uniref:2Fe-2S iron-sulfur cluster-binding protein n=1 Tax=Fulvivirga ligni TaxID=2904246 RepID=UPI001F3B26EE|nr:2Fe-2S iron-sulfur cluster-binding protein [Fulvivirga ligni]UII22939.1 (2Fe-2S)-binding protein [Fulvivirga ligni]
MPKIVIKNLGDKVINTNATDKSVLSILQENYQDWMHACGGKGRCTSCRMIVKEGMSNLSELNIHEQRYREKNALQEDERLTCQSVLQDGEIIIEVPAPTKLPHLTYSY